MSDKNLNIAFDRIWSKICTHPQTFALTPFRRLTFQRIIMSSLRRAFFSKSHAVYTTISQAAIAEDVGCCNETVSYAVCLLGDMGLLSITRRRSIDERWQTNLYRFTPMLISMIGDICSQVLKLFTKVKKSFDLITSVSLSAQLQRFKDSCYGLDLPAP